MSIYSLIAWMALFAISGIGIAVCIYVFSENHWHEMIYYACDAIATAFFCGVTAVYYGEANASTAVCTVASVALIFTGIILTMLVGIMFACATIHHESPLYEYHPFDYLLSGIFELWTCVAIALICTSAADHYGLPTAWLWSCVGACVFTLAISAGIAQSVMKENVKENNESYKRYWLDDERCNSGKYADGYFVECRTGYIVRKKEIITSGKNYVLAETGEAINKQDLLELFDDHDQHWILNHLEDNGISCDTHKGRAIKVKFIPVAKKKAAS